MDLAALTNELAEVESQLSRGTERLARQREIVAHLHNLGQDTGPAMRLLDALAEAQRRHEEHRTRLAAAIAAMAGSERA